MPQPDFSRGLTESNTKIISICDLCGYKIVASVTEGLKDREREHVAACIGRTAKVPSAPDQNQRSS